MNNRIIMPLEGFVQSLSVQDNIVKQLMDVGVLKKNPVQEENQPHNS